MSQVDATQVDAEGAADQSLDPITLAVLQNGLQQVCNEMDLAFVRAAFSPVISEALDRSDGIYHKASGELIAQGDLGLPVFVDTMQFGTQAVIERARDLAPGDLYIVNDPYLGGTHLQEEVVCCSIVHGQSTGGMRALGSDGSRRRGKRGVVEHCVDVVSSGGPAFLVHAGNALCPTHFGADYLAKRMQVVASDTAHRPKYVILTLMIRLSDHRWRFRRDKGRHPWATIRSSNPSS